MKILRLLKCAAFLLLALISTSAFSQQGKFIIEGKFSGLPDGKALQLIPTATHKDEKPIGEAIVKNGKFKFNGSINEPRLFFVKVAGDSYAGFSLMAEPGKIMVKGKVDSVKKSDGYVLDFKDVKVSGSKSHDQYLGKTSLRKQLDADYEAYHTNNQKILDELGNAGKNKDTTSQKKLRETAEYKKFAADEKAFFEKVEKSTNELILKNKDSWWGPFLMLHQLSYLTPDQKEVYEQFSAEAKNSYYGKIVKDNLYPVSKVGKPAPSLAFENDSKQAVAFSSLMKDKKYAIIDFWASWCGPCRKQLPALKAFYEDMNDKGVEIISVSIDKKDIDWTKALEEEKMPWPNFLDRQSIADAWNVKAIPAMFLVDEKGIVVAENVSIDDVRKKLQ